MRFELGGTGRCGDVPSRKLKIADGGKKKTDVGGVKAEEGRTSGDAMVRGREGSPESGGLGAGSRPRTDTSSKGASGTGREVLESRDLWVCRVETQ